MCLEFSQVPDPLLRQIYDTYSFHVIPGMGELVANDRASYQYLVESIRKFSNQEELLARMDAVGFQLTKYTNMTAGIVAVHEGWKPLQA
jgi:ubiquinone/menaquinone biosynthesis C-methylase UbiE